MASPQQVEAWIEQAEDDLEAARVDAAGLSECHRRYWIQQAYEKAIKAYALMRWKGASQDEAEFAQKFLLQHSPVQNLEASTPMSKALHLLEREAVV